MRALFSIGAALGAFLAVAGGINLAVAYLLWNLLDDYNTYAALTVSTGMTFGVLGIVAAWLIWDALEDWR